MPPGLARDRVLCVRSAGCSLTARTGYNPLRMLPAAVAPPPIVQHPIPFGARRRADMAAYARRHYGLRTWRLRSPRVIVEHLTVNGSLQATYAAFAPNVPDPELHERPGTCSHFVVGRDGTIVAARAARDHVPAHGRAELDGDRGRARRLPRRRRARATAASCGPRCA